MKKNLLILLFGVFAVVLLSANSNWNPEDPFPFSHNLSADEAELMNTMERDFVETDPPNGQVRAIAEWEPMKAVMIRYPLGIPVSLIAEMAEYTPVICIVSSSQQNQAISTFTNGGVNIDNVSFMNYSTETYWCRDYGPWFVAYGDDEIGVCNFKYNRPRPTDDEIPVHYAEENNLEWFGMNMEHTGGNYMCDGYYQAVSTDLVFDENSISETEIRQKFEDYLGVTEYHITADPLGDYIKHVDCWGKYLDVDKILISRVPSTHSQYDEYEAIANYFSTVTSSYGTPMQVFRADIPGNNQATPYSNSLILNGKVFVPITGTSYDANALEVYEEAMPGYEIIPISPGSQGWLNTDALHCRTHEIADDEMLYIYHIPTSSTPVNEDILIEADFIAYSNTALLENEIKLSYQIDGGDFTEIIMNNTEGNSYSATIPAQPALTEIGYFLSGEDISGKSANHPYIGEPDPHTFSVGVPEIIISTEEINITIAAGETSENSFEISNTGQLDLLYNISYTSQIVQREEFTYDIPNSPNANSYNSNTYTENGWTDVEITDEGIIGNCEINYSWSTDNYPQEGSFLVESPSGNQTNIATAQTSGTYSVNLSNFIDEPMNGTWKFWIEDSYGDGGHQVTNISFTITTLSPEESWMSVTPISGVIASSENALINITSDASELSNGDYVGNIVISSNDPDGEDRFVTLNLTIGEVNADENAIKLGSLGNNYPNPFNPTTAIEYSITDSNSRTQISVYNIKGQKVKSLVDSKLQSGKYSVVWNGKNEADNKVSSGVYFYKISNGNYVETKKMILLK